jgi:CheY-like chemotaxis protein
METLGSHDARDSNTALSGTQSRPSLAGKTVVIADDDVIVLDYLELRCRHLGLRVETATDGLRAVLKVGKARPDLLILDLNLPDVEGFRVVERLADPKFDPVPVIVLTGRSDDPTKRRCKDLNVYYVHKSEDTWSDLEPLIFEFLVKKPSNPKPEESEPAVTPRILLVDDDPQRLRTLVQTLQKYQLHVFQASSGVQGFLVALKNQPDLIITNYDMEQGSGHYLLSRIKSTPSTQHIPVVVYAGKRLDAGHVYAIQRDLRGRGQAAAFIGKPIDPATLVAEVRRHVTLPCHG